jgi:hypothetical protein
MNTIQQFLSENNYIVVARATDDGCSLLIPKTTTTKECIITYKYDKSGVKRLVIDKNEIINEKLIKCPPYAHHAVIMLDIIMCCQYILYNPLFILFQDYNGNECNENDFIIDIEYQQKNKTLIPKLGMLLRLIPLILSPDTIKSAEEIAKKNKIESGYKALLKMIGETTNE